MGIWRVYCYTGKNGKKYIGITSRSVEQRAQTNGISYVKEDNSKFGRAIEKYGFDFFTVEILEENLTLDEAQEKEKYYIDLYDTYYNGYNNTFGGEGRIKTDRTLVQKLWNEGKSIKEIEEETGYGHKAIGWALDEIGVDGAARISRQAGKYLTYKIYQYDKNGNYIQCYNSIADAERATGIANANISSCINGKRQTAGGFQWTKEYKEHLDNYKKRPGFHKELYQYSLDGRLLNKFATVAEAAEKLGFGKEYLAKKAREQGKAYGYIWSYEELVF